MLPERHALDDQDDEAIAPRIVHVTQLKRKAPPRTIRQASHHSFADWLAISFPCCHIFGLHRKPKEYLNSREGKEP
jgi:hypothetical protein